jgi:hypothetical protein
VEHPFGLFWPISAFSLSGITREAERDPHEATPIQLVSIEQPSEQIPVNPMILDGQVRYLGEERLNVAGEQRRTFKFSIKAALSPELIIWTTRKGLLIRVAIQHPDKDWLEENMKLIRFKEYAGFD